MTERRNERRKEIKLEKLHVLDLSEGCHAAGTETDTDSANGLCPHKVLPWVERYWMFGATWSAWKIINDTRSTDVVAARSLSDSRVVYVRLACNITHGRRIAHMASIVSVLGIHNIPGSNFR